MKIKKCESRHEKRVVTGVGGHSAFYKAVAYNCEHRPPGIVCVAVK